MAPLVKDLSSSSGTGRKDGISEHKEKSIMGEALQGMHTTRSLIKITFCFDCIILSMQRHTMHLAVYWTVKEFSVETVWKQKRAIHSAA